MPAQHTTVKYSSSREKNKQMRNKTEKTRSTKFGILVAQENVEKRRHGCLRPLTACCDIDL